MKREIARKKQTLACTIYVILCLINISRSQNSTKQVNPFLEGTSENVQKEETYSARELDLSIIKEHISIKNNTSEIVDIEKCIYWKDDAKSGKKKKLSNIKLYFKMERTTFDAQINLLLQLIESQKTSIKKSEQKLEQITDYIENKREHQNITNINRIIDRLTNEKEKLEENKEILKNRKAAGYKYVQVNVFKILTNTLNNIEYIKCDEFLIELGSIETKINFLYARNMFMVLLSKIMANSIHFVSGVNTEIKYRPTTEEIESIRKEAEKEKKRNLSRKSTSNTIIRTLNLTQCGEAANYLVYLFLETCKIQHIYINATGDNLKWVEKYPLVENYILEIEGDLEKNGNNTDTWGLTNPKKCSFFVLNSLANIQVEDLYNLNVLLSKSTELKILMDWKFFIRSLLLFSTLKRTKENNNEFLSKFKGILRYKREFPVQEIYIYNVQPNNNINNIYNTAEEANILKSNNIQIKCREIFIIDNRVEVKKIEDYLLNSNVKATIEPVFFTDKNGNKPLINHLFVDKISYPLSFNNRTHITITMDTYILCLISSRKAFSNNCESLVLKKVTYDKIIEIEKKVTNKQTHMKIKTLTIVMMNHPEKKIEDKLFIDILTWTINFFPNVRSLVIEGLGLVSKKNEKNAAYDEQRKKLHAILNEKGYITLNNIHLYNITIYSKAADNKEENMQKIYEGAQIHYKRIINPPSDLLPFDNESYLPGVMKLKTYIDLIQIIHGYMPEKEESPGIYRNAQKIDKSNENIKILNVISNNWSPEIEKYKEERERFYENICPICQDNMEPEKINENLKYIYILKCYHTICEICLYELCASSNNFTCPMCRKEMDISIISGIVRNFITDQSFSISPAAVTPWDQLKKNFSAKTEKLYITNETLEKIKNADALNKLLENSQICSFLVL